MASREALLVLELLWRDDMHTPAAPMALMAAKSDPHVLAGAALGIAKALLDELEDEFGEGTAAGWLAQLDVELRERENR